MKEENNDIDKLFRENLEKHQMQAPPNSWDLLKADLDNYVPEKEDKRRRFLIPFLILLLLLGVYYIVSYNTNNVDKISEIKSDIQTPHTNNNNIVNNNSSQAESKVIIKEDSSSVTSNEAHIDNYNGSKDQHSNKSLPGSTTNTISTPNIERNTKASNNLNSQSKGILKNKTIIKPLINSKSIKKKNIRASNEPNKNPITKVNNYTHSDNINTAANNTTKTEVPIIDKLQQNLSDTLNQVNVLSDNKQNDINNSVASDITLKDSINKAEIVLEENMPVITDSTNKDTLSNLESDIVNTPQVEIKKRFPFSMEIFGAPLYTVNFMTDNNPGNQKDDPSSYASRENSRFSFSTGIALRYPLNDRFSFSMGAYYSTIAYAVAVNRIYANLGTDNKPHFQYLTSWGTIQMPYFYPGQIINVGDSLDFNTTCEQVVKFINIPIIARYNISNSKLSWFIDAGFSINFKTNERAVIKVDDEEYAYENERIGIKDMNYYAILGVGGSYNFNNNLSIFIEPIIRASISSITENIPVKTYPNSFGLHIGMAYRF